MLSDSIFQIGEDLLEAVSIYDYSDDYRREIIHILRKLNEIRDDLDTNAGDGDASRLLKNDKPKSKRLAYDMFKKAQKNRE